MRLNRWTVAGALVLAALVALGAHARPRATTVRLLLRGERGERIQPSKVSLLFDWWGGNDVVDLPSAAGVTSIDMDSAWVAAKWPNWSEMEGARVLIKADGYAPMLSDTFAWLDQKRHGVDVVTETTISLKGQTALVRPGTQQDFAVTMRRPVTRRIRFIDQLGRPAAGLDVAVHMFWTQQNHCGVFEGDRLVASTVTDAEGRISVPDGDFDYGISLLRDDDRAVFDGEPVFYQRTVPLTGSETTVKVRRFDRRTVAVRIVDRDAPVTGARVIGHDRYQGCMDPGLRPLGITDAAGNTVLRDVAPDRFKAIVVCRDNQEVWSGIAEAFATSSVRIDLSAAFTRIPTEIPACHSRSLSDFGIHNPPILNSPNPQIH